MFSKKKKNRPTHEIKKVSKICEEITVFLAHHGNTKIDVSIELDDDVRTMIFKFDQLDEDVKQTLQTGFSIEREIEFEEYGWELLGESDSVFEATLIGRLIDDFSIEHSNGKHILTLHRR